MRRLLAIAIALVMGWAACDGCPAERSANGAASLPLPALGPLPTEVPVPGAIYQEAYDQASEEISADNAGENLRAIERDIERERRALQ